MGARKAIVSFGRYNPPTLGHKVVLDTMVELGKREAGADTSLVSLFVVPSPSSDSKRNPLTVSERSEILSQVVDANIHVGIDNENPKTLLEVASLLSDRDYNVLIVVAGSDRVIEFQDLLDRYNGKETKSGELLYEFDSIQVTQAGDSRKEDSVLDPDADGDVSEVSGSKARQAAANNDFDLFLSMFIDPSNKKLAKDTFKRIQNVLGVEVDEEEDPLTEQRRRVQEAIKAKVMGRDNTHSPHQITEQTSAIGIDGEEEDEELIGTQTTKTFLRYGGANVSMCETSDAILIKDINVDVRKDESRSVNELFLEYAPQVATLLGYAGSLAKDSKKEFIIHTSRIPAGKKLKEISLRRGELLGLAIRCMPPKLTRRARVEVL